jgi:hypothetical protein
VLLDVVGGDAPDADLEQAPDVVVGHVAPELGGTQPCSLLHGLEDLLLGLRGLDLLVHAVLDEYALERHPVLAVDEPPLVPLELG